jgi:hypothetical protein
MNWGLCSWQHCIDLLKLVFPKPWWGLRINWLRSLTCSRPHEGRLGWICGCLLLRCLSRGRICLRPAFLPKSLGNLQCFDFQILPPRHFIAGLMQLPVMTAAERHGELVADFETQSSGLGKAQVMRIGRLPAADEAGL